MKRVCQLVLVFCMFAFAWEIAAGNFSATLLVQSEAVDDQTLRLGMAAGGTAGYDVGLDVFAPPAPQEPVNLDAYFPVSHPLITRLSTDYRAVSDRAVYTFKVRADNDPFTLSWDVSTIPDNFTHIQLSQKSPLVPNPVDMRNQMSLELDPIASSYYVFEIVLFQNHVAFTVQSQNPEVDRQTLWLGMAVGGYGWL